MAFQIPPRTGVVTTTTGTGAYALGAALATHRTFAQAVSAGWLADGDTVPYWCADAGSPAAIEEGIGTYSAGGNTLARTTILRSSSGGAAINWAGGSKDLVVGLTSAGLLALLAAVNKFTANQEIEAANPKLILDALSATGGFLEFHAAGTMRARVHWSDSGALLLDYLSNLGVVQGRVMVSASGFEYSATEVGPGSGAQVDRFPSGTALPFCQAAAPTGWVKSTAHNDKALRVVSGSGGGAGGSRALSAAVVGGHVLTIAQMPQHSHAVAYVDQDIAYSAGANNSPAWANFAGPPSATEETDQVGGGTSHDHALALAYIDVIVCVKS